MQGKNVLIYLTTYHTTLQDIKRDDLVCRAQSVIILNNAYL